MPYTDGHIIVHIIIRLARNIERIKNDRFRHDMCCHIPGFCHISVEEKGVKDE